MISNINGPLNRVHITFMLLYNASILSACALITENGYDGTMKTYLTVWLYSEGSGPTTLVEKLHAMGFKPIKGQHDFVYDWGRQVELEEIFQIGNSVHETLRGLKVMYKLETI